MTHMRLNHTRPRSIAFRSMALAVTALAATAVLAACGSSDSVAPTMGEPMGQPMGEAPMAEAAMPAMDGSVSTDTSLQKSIITSGTMAVEVPDVVEATSDLRLIVAEANGQIDQDSESVNPEDPKDRISDLTIRVPADSFAAVTEQIEALGTVTSRSISRTDVSIQVVDVDARIAAIESSITRLKALIDQATTTADLIEAENALTNRQAELDSLRAQRAYLADQVGMSTLQVSLRWEETAESTNTAFVLLIVGLVLGVVIGLLAWLITALIRKSMPSSRSTPTSAPN